MLKRTPLYEIHKTLGAKMVDFGGWDMPVQYTNIRTEHEAVRERVGLFDVSHMGELVITGQHAKTTAQYLTCNDINRLAAGRCQYSGLLTPEGTFVDDIIVYPFGEERIFLCVNASNTDKDFQWLQQRSQSNARVLNESDQWYQLALQGPQAQELLQGLTELDLSSMKRFSFREALIGGVSTLLSRTGYTGEDGFEIYGRTQEAPQLWQLLMETGQPFELLPCGLGARDTLRLEAAYPLYGHEISDRVTPWEAGLDWIVKMDQGDFVGRTALQKLQDQKKNRRVLIGFVMDDRSIPRSGYPISVGERAIGQVASGTYSPTRMIGIGTALVEAPQMAAGEKIDIDIRGKKRKATVVSLPFYKSKHL